MRRGNSGAIGLTRRAMLRLTLGSAAAVLASGKHGWAGPAPRRLAFDNLHTGESVIETYWADGAYRPEALAQFDHVLRDFRTNEVMAIDRRLLDLLYAVHGRLGSARPFAIISGYRSPATNAKLAAAGGGVARRSLHCFGMAIDVRLEDRSLRDLRRVAIALKQGGVGFYPRDNFVHVDVGRVRQW